MTAENSLITDDAKILFGAPEIGRDLLDGLRLISLAEAMKHKKKHGFLWRTEPDCLLSAEPNFNDDAIDLRKSKGNERHNSQLKKKSWAGLFKTYKPKDLDISPVDSYDSPQNIPQASIDHVDSDTSSFSLTDICRNFDPLTPYHGIDNQPAKPRGLVNESNLCFVNCILQSLLYCSPFYRLIKLIQMKTKLDLNGKTPVIESWVAFCLDMSPRVHDGDSKVKLSFHRPDSIYDALKLEQRLSSSRGSQEDAEEFLGIVLDSFHEELNSVLGDDTSAQTESATSDYMLRENNVSQSDQDWISVKSKKKKSGYGKAGVMEGDDFYPEQNSLGSVVRQIQISPTPITRIFGGKIRSIIRCPGRRDSVIIEPFTSLQLDITPDGISNINEALVQMVKPDKLDQSYRSTIEEQVLGENNALNYTLNAKSSHSSPSYRNNAYSSITKQILLEHVPPILILHLKRFMFDSELSQTVKIQKYIRYGAELSLKPSLFSEKAPQAHNAGPNGIEYELAAVVYHHGKSATDGHYTCAIRRKNSADDSHQWYNFDDTIITKVKVDEVLNYQNERSEYLLFYERKV